MENLAAYSARKRREAALLERVPSVSLPDPPPNLSGPAAEKLAVFRRRAANPAAAAWPETNWSERGELSLGDHRLRYRYQRFDLTADAPPIYPAVDLAGAVETAFFTSSGMAALAAVFLALDRILVGPLEMWSLRDAYFESQHLAARYTKGLRLVLASGFAELSERREREARRAMVHVDSICADLAGVSAALNDPDVVMVLFDTTCFHRTDPRIAAIVAEAFDRSLAVILVRSHMKLDTLGLENGRLGSVVVYAPPGMKAAAKDGIEGVRRLVPDVIRSLGLGPKASDFFLAASRDTAELVALSAERAARTADNCVMMAAELQAGLWPAVGLRRYQHRMFLTLHHPHWTEPEPVQRCIETVVGAARAAGTCVVSANSFGFDFTVCADVLDVSSGLFALRIAPSDEPWPRVRPLIRPILGRLSPAPA